MIDLLIYSVRLHSRRGGMMLSVRGSMTAEFLRVAFAYLRSGTACPQSRSADRLSASGFF
jgi:hypothetical protein